MVNRKSFGNLTHFKWNDPAGRVYHTEIVHAQDLTTVYNSTQTISSKFRVLGDVLSTAYLLDYISKKAAPVVLWHTRQAGNLSLLRWEGLGIRL